MDRVSCFGAQSVYLLVQEEIISVLTHIPLCFTVVMFFCTCLFLDTRMESHQGSLSLHVPLARIYGHGKSAVLSYSELQ